MLHCCALINLARRSRDLGDGNPLCSSSSFAGGAHPRTLIPAVALLQHSPSRTYWNQAASRVAKPPTRLLHVELNLCPPALTDAVPSPPQACQQLPATVVPRILVPVAWKPHYCLSLDHRRHCSFETCGCVAVSRRQSQPSVTYRPPTSHNNKLSPLLFPKDAPSELQVTGLPPVPGRVIGIGRGQGLLSLDCQNLSLCRSLGPGPWRRNRHHPKIWRQITQASRPSAQEQIQTVPHR